MKADKALAYIFRILGPVIFIYILYQIDYRRFVSELASIRWPFLTLAFILLVACVLLKALRWRAVLLALKISVSRAYAINLYWLGVFVGMITPGRVGELIKIYFLKLRGFNFFRSFFSIVFDRLSDIAFMLVLGYVVSLYYFNSVSVYIGLSGVLLALLVLLFFLLSERQSGLHGLFSKAVAKVFSIDAEEYNRFTFERLWRGIRGISAKDMAVFFAYMLAGWLAYFYARYAVSQALALPLTFTEVAITSMFIGIVSALPISVAGLGTREAAVIYAFGLFGLNKEIALLFSLLIFTLDSLITSVGLIPYLKESSLINKIKRENPLMHQ